MASVGFEAYGTREAVGRTFHASMRSRVPCLSMMVAPTALYLDFEGVSAYLVKMKQRHVSVPKEGSFIFQVVSLLFILRKFKNLLGNWEQFCNHV